MLGQLSREGCQVFCGQSRALSSSLYRSQMVATILAASAGAIRRRVPSKKRASQYREPVRRYMGVVVQKLVRIPQSAVRGRVSSDRAGPLHLAKPAWRTWRRCSISRWTCGTVPSAERCCFSLADSFLRPADRDGTSRMGCPYGSAPRACRMRSKRSGPS